MSGNGLRFCVGVAATAAALTLAACGGTQSGGTPNGPSETPTTFRVGQSGPQGIQLERGPQLAAADTTQLGNPVNGILCQRLQQLAYQSASHLQVYVRGRSRALPGGIGMLSASSHNAPGGAIYSASTCYYWLHTRAADGIIEAQSPQRRVFTLGDFFAVWNQPLSRTNVAGARGRVTARVNGKLWKGAITAIPLNNHAQIELAVGRPVPRTRGIDWAAANL